MKNEIKDKKLDLFLMFIEEILKKLEEESQEDLTRQYVPPRCFKKEGKGLKTMTPNQLLTRLPILLAQKKEQEIIVKN